MGQHKDSEEVHWYQQSVGVQQDSKEVYRYRFQQSVGVQQHSELVYWCQHSVDCTRIARKCAGTNRCASIARYCSVLVPT